MSYLTPAQRDALKKRWEELACWRMSHGLTKDEREEFDRIEEQLEQENEQWS